MRATFRPLRRELWQGEFTPSSKRRSRWTFKASWTDTMGLLKRELAHLGATEVVIEADFRESDIRLDGLPRANARVPDFPGVRIAFESKHGPLVYQTDTCFFWQHNVRSIALGLEALRAVDRYGITARAEQYTGFKAIGTGAGPDAFRSADDALSWLRQKSGVAGAEGITIKTLVRLVAKRCHPDHGGTQREWARYDEAVRLLRAGGLL